MPRKLKRGDVGRNVTCATCSNSLPIVRTRERVELRSRTSSAAGSLTDVKLMKFTGLHDCDRCVMLLELGLDPLAPQNRAMEPTQSAQGAML